jgi:hypothetical protein
MRSTPFPIGSTDAVHVYSDSQHIWLQLRRNVPGEQSIARPSFKVALSLTPEQAVAIAGELFTAATRKASANSNGQRKPKATQPPK